MQATISAKSGGQEICVREKTNWALIIIRILTAFAGLMIFFPEVNPGRLMSDINANTSLFTAAISYSTLTDSFARSLRMGWVQPWHFYLIMGGCALLMLGIILSAIGACMSLGNHRMKRAAVKLPLIGSVLMLGGIGTLVYLNSILPALEKAERLKLMTPTGAIAFWAVLGGAAARIQHREHGHYSQGHGRKDGDGGEIPPVPDVPACSDSDGHLLLPAAVRLALCVL